MVDKAFLISWFKDQSIPNRTLGFRNEILQVILQIEAVATLSRQDITSGEFSVETFTGYQEMLMADCKGMREILDALVEVTLSDFESEDI